jgi:hypothetical protein
MHSSNFLLTSKTHSSLLLSALSLYYLCTIGENRSTREAGISFICRDLIFIGIPIPYPNLTAEKQFHFQNLHTIHRRVCSLKYDNYLYRIYAGP